jgi:hypothetical protein
VSPRGIPTAAELAEALREFLTDEVMAQTTGALRFHARVASNVAGILERELLLGPAHAAAHRARLASLGMGDDAELARAIRDGRMDTRLDEVRRALMASAADDLRVYDPRRVEPAG